jgi:hypothetical protein
MRIARVFPRKTEQTPNDELVFFSPPMMKGCLPEIDEVHVSCTFTYDKDKAEYLAYQWEGTGIPVRLGGPAYGDYTKDFIPGRYLKHGCVITSVGCPNHCWFCSVPKRAGNLKELEIKDGYIIQDDNLLACSDQHIRSVFEMLKMQKQKAEFRGGLEAKLLKPWHIELFLQSKLKNMFFAYDTPDDYEPLVEAGSMLKEAGIFIKSRIPQAYVLMGYPKDTQERAEQRCIDTLKAGFIPFAMLYRDENGNVARGWNEGWDNIVRRWIRQAVIYTRHKQYFK